MGYYTREAGRRYFERFVIPETAARSRDRLFAAKYERAVSSEVRDSVFEYGAGSGRNLVAISRLARKLGAYDLSEYSRAACRTKGIETFDTPADIPLAAWDVVICHHALEHMPNPLETLKLLRALLCPRGILFLETPVESDTKVRRPIADTLSIQDAGWVRSTVRKLTGDSVDQDHHLFTWTPTTMRNVLSEAGLELRSCRILYGAREDLLSPLARINWTLFTLTVRMMGHVLNRRALMCVAVPVI